MEFSANFPAPEASGGAIPSSHFTQLMVSVGARSLADARQALRSLEEDLSELAILGVDLECGYGDVVCTLQMATVKGTVVLDALRLHGHIAELVSSIFLDGSVIKLFHAPRNDMRWLWSNFGVQVVSRRENARYAGPNLGRLFSRCPEEVNMFDTDTVAMLVNERESGVGRHRSLKELCKRFLQMDLDKTHQRSDWRLRPLPEEMWAVLLPLATHLASMADDKMLLKESLQACRRTHLATGYESNFLEQSNSADDRPRRSRDSIQGKRSHHLHEADHKTNTSSCRSQLYARLLRLDARAGLQVALRICTDCVNRISWPPRSRVVGLASLGLPQSTGAAAINASDMAMTMSFSRNCSRQLL
ncbi:EXOSC10 [Symbiodinium sp. KB8]|nr:EXOSC10 [Symbiodinium sp. KB8]